MHFVRTLNGLIWDLNPGRLAPETTLITLEQQKNLGNEIYCMVAKDVRVVQDVCKDYEAARFAVGVTGGFKVGPGLHMDQH